MPILKREFELGDGKKVWVRQASGLEKIGIEAIHARCLRKCRDFGPNPTEWTEEQTEELLDLIDDAGGGLEAQISAWLPQCVMGDIDPNLLTTEEMLPMLQFIKGEDELDGAVPLE